MIEKQPSCDDVDEPALLPVAEARRRLFDALQVVRESETVSLANALNRVLATDIVAKINVPDFNNSAMDGYAIRHSDLAIEK